MTLSPERRAHLASIARLGGLARAATGDMKAFARSGTDTYRASFINGHGCKLCPFIDIPAELDHAERERRADALYRLHMSRLARR